MEKPIYLTGNKGKFDEAQHIFKDMYGFDIEIKNPDFEIIEIQAKSCEEVVKFSVKYACEKLGRPCIKSDSGLYIDALGGLPGPYNAYFDKQIGVDKFLEIFKIFEPFLLSVLKIFQDFLCFIENSFHLNNAINLLLVHNYY